MADLLPAAEPTPDPELPPPIERVRWLAIGLAGAAAVGLVLTMLFPITNPQGVGGTLIALGLGLLLAGGTTGGGYFQRSTPRADTDKAPVMRLSARLRPAASPPSRWLVGAGLLYAAAGAAIIERF